MSLRSLLSIALLLIGFPAVLVQGQTDLPERPRRAQSAPPVASKSNHQAVSADASAEAKRLYKAGVKYGSAGLFQQAAASFEQAVRLNPTYADAYPSLGHAYYDLAKWEQAIDSLQHGLALKPNDKDSQSRLAHARVMLERESRSSEAKAENEPANGATVSLSSVAPSTTNTKRSSDSTSLTK